MKKTLVCLLLALTLIVSMPAAVFAVDDVGPYSITNPKPTRVDDVGPYSIIITNPTRVDDVGPY